MSAYAPHAALIAARIRRPNPIVERLEMLPFLTTNDEADQGIAYAIHARQLRFARFTIGPLLSDSAYLIVRQLSGRVVCAARHSFRAIARTATALLRHVGHVLCLSAEEQVGGIDTARIVAAMTDGKAVRNGTSEQFPGEAMRSYFLSLKLDDAIATLVAPALPQPATISARHLSPEAYIWRHCGINAGHRSRSYVALRGAMLRAVSAAPGLSVALNYTIWTVNTGVSA